MREFASGASWMPSNLLARWHLSHKSIRKPGNRPKLNCTGAINVKVLRWHYADAHRYPVTDSQGAPRALPHCSSWCHVDELHAPLQSGSSSFDSDPPHLILLSPHDHGRAWTQTWCTHPFPAPFEVQVHSPGATLWGAYTYENVVQFPMLVDPKVSRGVDLSINYRRDANIQISWFCPHEGGTAFGDYYQPPSPNKPHLVSLVASRCRNDWTKYVTQLDEALPSGSLVKYGTCFGNSQMIPCFNSSQRGMCNSQWYENKIAALSKSRFTLVFENTARLDDYVTEKLSHALLAGSVPVIWGASNIRDWLPSPECCIIVTGTPLERNPQALAELLFRYVDDEAAYRERFFKWKSQPRLESFQRKVDMCWATSGCRICEWIRESAACKRD